MPNAVFYLPSNGEVRSGGAASDNNALTRYSLRSDVFVCNTSDVAIFLDLGRNRYFGLAGPECRALSRYVGNWPLDDDDSQAAQDICQEADVIRVANELVERGLLCVGSATKHGALKTGFTSTAGNLVSIGEEISRGVHVNPHHVVRFLGAYANARYLLRFHSLQQIVHSIAARRPTYSIDDELLDIDKTARLIAAFRTIRPWVFRAREQCLLHSLVLVTFLLSYGIHVRWVFGVKTHPWGAHSWVQQANFVLDTNPEKVCSYAPILSI